MTTLTQIQSSGVVRGLDATAKHLYVQVSGSYAYVGDLKWLRVFDISVPSSPRELASFNIPATVTGIKVEDTNVYVAASDAGMMILDAETGQN